MLLENVGHHILQGAMHLADRKAVSGGLCSSIQAVPVLMSWAPRAHVPADVVHESENQASEIRVCTQGLVG